MILEEQIKNCQKCPLYLDMPFSPVPGYGNKKAKIMLIGEAPGKDEAVMEEPFVGRCGKFLDKQLIEPAGLVRSELYISNLMKCSCRDGNKNRRPKRNEIRACRDWLSKEIDEINPKIIITLGELPVRYFGLLGKLDNLVGYEHHIDNNGVISSYMVLPAFHPSYLLQYGRSKTERTLNVFKRAKELI